MAEHYFLIKHIHQGSALLSLSLFVLRGIWMMGWPHLLQARLVKIVPHIIDSVLLASALILAWVLQQYPFVHGWVTAKVIALLVYIVLGSIALKRGRTLQVRIVAMIGALLTFAYILAVAFSKQVVPL